MLPERPREDAELEETPVSTSPHHHFINTSPTSILGLMTGL